MSVLFFFNVNGRVWRRASLLADFLRTARRRAAVARVASAARLAADEIAPPRRPRRGRRGRPEKAVRTESARAPTAPAGPLPPPPPPFAHPSASFGLLSVHHVGFCFTERVRFFLYFFIGCISWVLRFAFTCFFSFCWSIKMNELIARPSASFGLLSVHHVGFRFTERVRCFPCFFIGCISWVLRFAFTCSVSFCLFIK